MSEILPSSSLGTGQDEVGQTGLRCHSQKSETQNQSFFSLQSTRLAESFEGVNCSLAQSMEELWTCKDMCKQVNLRANRLI